MEYSLVIYHERNNRIKRGLPCLAQNLFVTCFLHVSKLVDVISITMITKVGISVFFYKNPNSSTQLSFSYINELPRKDFLVSELF